MCASADNNTFLRFGMSRFLLATLPCADCAVSCVCAGANMTSALMCLYSGGGRMEIPNFAPCISSLAM